VPGGGGGASSSWIWEWGWRELSFIGARGVKKEGVLTGVIEKLNSKGNSQ
jgi:hypothetical protein